MSRLGPQQLHDRLLAAYGPQHWWPADSPFEVAVGALLTQNTNWQNVEKAIGGLKKAGLLEPEAIIRADNKTLETAVRPSGFFRQKAARLRILCRFWLDAGGDAGLKALGLEQARKQLLKLNGIGPETADSILLYALDMPIFVVDAYTRRIASRLGLCPPDIGYHALQAYFHQRLPHDVTLFNELHALIVAHAKQHCRVRPGCAACPLATDCPACASS